MRRNSNNDQGKKATQSIDDAKGFFPEATDWHYAIQQKPKEQEDKEQRRNHYKELYNTRANDILDQKGNTRFLESVIHQKEDFYLPLLNNPLVSIGKSNDDGKNALDYFAERNNLSEMKQCLKSFPDAVILHGQRLLTIAVENRLLDMMMLLFNQFRTLREEGKMQSFDESCALALAFKRNALELIDALIKENCLFPLRFGNVAAIPNVKIQFRIELIEALDNKNADYSVVIKKLYEYKPVEILLLLSFHGGHRMLFKELLRKELAIKVNEFFSHLKLSDATFMAGEPEHVRKGNAARLKLKYFLIKAMLTYNLEKVVFVLKSVPFYNLTQIYSTSQFQDALILFKKSLTPLRHRDDPAMTAELSVARSADRQEILFHIENSMLEIRSAEVKQANKSAEPEAKKTVWKGAFFAAIEANKMTPSSAPDQQPKQMSWRFI